MNACAAGQCEGGDPVQVVLLGELGARGSEFCSLESIKGGSNSMRVP